MYKKAGLIAYLLIVMITVFWAQDAFSDGMLIPALPHVPAFAVKYHRVSVSIDQQVAQTKIDQVFRNEADQELEGTYLFPLPEEAVVSDFAMYVGDEEVFMCPSDPGTNPNTPFTHYELSRGSESFRGSYDYLGAWTDRPITIDLDNPLEKNPNIPIVWDMFSGSRRYISIVNHIPAGGNVVFINGRLELLRSRQWHAPNLPVLPPGIEFDPGLLEEAPEKWLDPYSD